MQDEPDVKSSVSDGADIVCFSTDKLLGGPQAGVVVGKKELIDKISQAPMMRALRVGKLTIASLQSVIRYYFNDDSLVENLPLFKMLETDKTVLKEKAELLKEKLSNAGINTLVVESAAQCGGGTLPDLTIDSYAVKIISTEKSQKERSIFAENIFQSLLQLEEPVLAILRKGEILFDVLTVTDKEINELVSRIVAVMKNR